MVSFELGKEIKKDVFRLVTSVGQRKNSEKITCRSLLLSEETLSIIKHVSVSISIVQCCSLVCLV